MRFWTAKRVWMVIALLFIAGTLHATSIEDLLRAGQLGEAERQVRQQLQTTEDWALYDLLGIVLSRQQRGAEAEDAFRRALELAPQEQRGVSRQHLARHFLLTGQQEAAFHELRLAARDTDLERELATTLAQLETRAGELGAAARQWRSLAERFSSVRALLALAEIETRRQKPSEAFKILQRTLDLAPNSEAVLAAYARAALAARLPVPAILALDPLTRMHPSVSEYAYMLGVSRMQAGDLPGALETLQRSTEIEPERALSWLALGLVLNKQKRFQEADAALRESLRRDPTNREALAARAEAAEGLGQLDDALELARRVLNQDPNHATANLALGMVMMKRQDFAAAREAFELSIATLPSAKAHYQLSLALARLGEREASQEHLELYRQALQSVETSLKELRARRLPIEASEVESRFEETRR